MVASIYRPLERDRHCYHPARNRRHAVDIGRIWSVGCGAWCGTAWFQWKWEERSRQLPIAVKELIPIVIAAAIWGESRRGTQIHCRCDNQAVVVALAARSSRETHMMHFLWCLFFVEAHHQCQLRASYISTRDNAIADHLSRNNLTAFFSKLPQADRNPTPIPPALPSLLLDPNMDWLSLAWTRQFKSIFIRD